MYHNCTERSLTIDAEPSRKTLLNVNAGTTAASYTKNVAACKMHLVNDGQYKQ